MSRIAFTQAYPGYDELEEDEGPFYVLEFGKPKFCVTCGDYPQFMHVSINDRPIIIVFPEIDDEVLLRVAAEWQKAGTEPFISEYEPDFGLSMLISDYAKMVGVFYG